METDYFSHPLRGIRTHFSYKARKRMFDLFMRAMRPARETTVLDLGVTTDRTLSESNYFERLYPYKDRLVAAGIEDARFLEAEFPGLKFIRITGEGLPFEDDQFDVLFCSTVLEHVGSHDDQKAFIREALRISRRFFLTTPNRMFPMEFHTILPFIHWLPHHVHQAMLRGLGMRFWAETANLNLLTPREALGLFPECRSLRRVDIRLFGIPSNIVIYGEK